MACRVVPDDPSVVVPHLGPDDLHALNRLTAYNRPELEGSDRRCGCFHCGSVFVAREVARWMVEKDGADTALCPHCGCDAVIYETPAFPLSTALFTTLYLGWFGPEHEERKNAATYAPSFSDYEDWLRKGIPFLMESRSADQVAGEVDLFREPERGDAGGMVRIETRGPRDLVLVDEWGRSLPYTVMTGQHRLVRELAEKHGPRLRGLIADPNDWKLRLIVEHA